jgi:hypothetical protein
MELFSAGKEQLETIKKWIDDSDVYMLILGQRYGSIDKETGKSYTELEYRYAFDERQKPGFAIILDEKIGNEKIAVKGMNRKDVMEFEHQDKYECFMKYVTSTRIVSFAETIDGIKAQIIKNMKQYEDNPNIIGWVRADSIQKSQENNQALQDRVSVLEKNQIMVRVEPEVWN